MALSEELKKLLLGAIGDPSSTLELIDAVEGGEGTGTVTQVNTGTGLTGGPITTTGTISLSNTTVTAGPYTNANITVDAQGRITLASNGSGGSGADTFLSNLTSPTSINQDLLPNSNLNFNLGSAGTSKSWNALFINGIYTPTNSQAIDIGGRTLYNSSSTAVINWSALTSGTSGQFLQTDGASNVTWAAPTGFANTTLSNLTSPTAVNQDLIRGGASDFTVKTRDASGTTASMRLKSGDSTTSSTGLVDIESGNSSGSGNSGSVQIKTGSSGSGNTGDITLQSSDATIGTGANSGGMFISTGTSDSGNSGNIEITAGISTSGTSGKIVLKDGSESVGAGAVWTLTDTAGSGTWATPSPQIMAFTSDPGPSGVAGTPMFDVAFTVPGLLATDTILAVTQMTAGASGTLALLGWINQANNALTGKYVADPGTGSVVVVAISR